MIMIVTMPLIQQHQPQQPPRTHRRRRRQPHIMDINFMGYFVLATTTLMTTMMMMTASGTIYTQKIYLKKNENIENFIYARNF